MSDRNLQNRRKLNFPEIQRRRSLEPKQRKYTVRDDLYGPGSETDRMLMTPRDLIVARDIRQASVRHETFPDVVNSVEGIKLWASNGFFHNEKGSAECFSCHLEIQDWKELEDPGRIHLERYPNCRFRRGEDAGNVPFNCRPVTPTHFSSDEDLSPTDITPRKRVAPPNFNTPPRSPPH